MNLFDLILFHILNNLAGKSRITDWIFVFFAEYIPYLLILLFIVLFFKTAGGLRWKLLTTTAVSAFLSRSILTELIRFLYHRPRPFYVWHVNKLISENSWSFPSGHAVFFFAVATSIYLYNRKWGVLFYVTAFITGITRVIVGVHYPTDIIGGALIGILCARLTYFVQSKLSKQFFSWKF